MYVQNLSALKTAASISLSMLAYWHLVLVRALLAKATGLLFCRSAALRPTCEALTCIVMGSEGSKYLRVVLLMRASFTC